MQLDVEKYIRFLESKFLEGVRSVVTIDFSDVIGELTQNEILVIYKEFLKINPDYDPEKIDKLQLDSNYKKFPHFILPARGKYVKKDYIPVNKSSSHFYIGGNAHYYVALARSNIRYIVAKDFLVEIPLDLSQLESELSLKKLKEIA